MKTLFVTLTALFSLFSTKSHADEGNVTPVVLEKFSNTFANASEVKWSSSNQYYKADFAYNGQYAAAFFNTDGELIATTRNITSIQLPVTLQASLKKDYKNLWISNLFEYSDESGTSYYVTLENADTQIVLKSSGSTSWSIFQKERKS